MQSRTAPPRNRIIADLAAFRGAHPILIVEVKAMTGAASIAAEWLVRLLVRLGKRDGHPIPFGMVVDLDDILVFDVRKADPAVPVCRLKSSDVFNAFDPDFSSKRIFDDYLLALTQTWLLEFGFSRIHTPPPGMRELEEVGLVDFLIEGSVHKKVHFADADPVR